MGGLRVFVSSTCVDLNSDRAQLRNLLMRLGHDPIMSDYSDVLYDHRAHTHASCLKEVSNADILIVLIGSRFGGTVVPQALPLIDAESIKGSSKKTDIIAEKESLSITQVEVLKAVDVGIPVFTFVDSRVYADHHVYQKNKSGGVADKIVYPSIDKPDTAKYIFEFVNYLNHRTANNAIIPYRNFSDIEEHLIRQWSLMFQRLLQEDRARATETRRGDILIEQLDDMKAVLLQSIAQGSARDVARNVLKFRRLADFLLGFRAISKIDFVQFDGSLQELFEEVGVVNIVEQRRSSLYRFALILKDGTYFGSRLPYSLILRLHNDWETFKALDQHTKQAIIDAVGDATTAPLLRYNPEPYIPDDEVEYSDPKIRRFASNVVVDLSPSEASSHSQSEDD